MAKVDYITIRGFKSIADIERLELRPINVIIGANGSGKSNFIGVFSFLRTIRNGTLSNYVMRSGGAERVLFFGSKETEEIFIHISFDSEVNQYSIELQSTEDDNLIPTAEHVFFWDKSKSYDKPFEQTIDSAGNEAGISKATARIGSHVQRYLDSWLTYHFHDTSVSSPMKKNADTNDNRRLRSDGSNIAAFLYFLKTKHAAEYTFIGKTFQRVAPFFREFVLEPSALNPESIRLEWRHQHSDAYFDTSSLSDGSLRFLALATLLLQPAYLRPSVILIDEPELGLHPYAITMLASLIKQASAETQVILSTQSAALLDHFDPDDVLVANLVDGGTQLTRLNDDDLKVWLDDYSLGQLWEKNEIGGRPGGR